MKGVDIFGPVYKFYRSLYSVFYIQYLMIVSQSVFITSERMKYLETTDYKLQNPLLWSCTYDQYLCQSVLYIILYYIILYYIILYYIILYYIILYYIILYYIILYYIILYYIILYFIILYYIILYYIILYYIKNIPIIGVFVVWHLFLQSGKFSFS